MKATVVFFVGISVGVFSNYVVQQQTAYAQERFAKAPVPSCALAETNRTQLSGTIPVLVQALESIDKQLQALKQKSHRH